MLKGHEADKGLKPQAGHLEANASWRRDGRAFCTAILTEGAGISSFSFEVGLTLAILFRIPESVWPGSSLTPG